MGKRNFTLRMACFLSIYLLTYFVPNIAINFAKHMPRIVGNFCFSFPQLMLPFNIMFWKNDLVISNSSTFFVVSGVYLAMLSVLFSYVTRPVKNPRMVVLFAFCFSIFSVISLNCILPVCGITVETRMP